ncbi:hypothetical protein BGZ58_004403 [Dissophora ornata]|nr:hypothetical protein BGZ58_004403 [Dissophora ornata]
MPRSREVAQDPALPSTPRTPTSKVTGSHQSARAAAENGFKVPTPKAPRTPTVPPVLHEPTSPSPMPMRRSRRDNSLPSHAQTIMRHGSRHDQHQTQPVVSVVENGGEICEEQELEAEGQPQSRADAHFQSQPRLGVSVPLTPTKRSLQGDTAQAKEAERKLRRVSHGIRSTSGGNARGAGKDSKDSQDMPWKDVAGAESNFQGADIPQNTEGATARTRDKRKLLQDENADFMTSERPAKSRVIASWNTSIRNTEGGQGATEASLLAIDGTTGEPPTQHPEDHEDKQVDGFHELDSDGEEEGELAPVMVSESAQKEMKDFEQGFHGLLGRFKLLSKIGEGTFSSVYKAIDLEYDRYDNSGWDYSVDDQPSANEKDSTGDAKDSAKDTANNVVEPNNVESGKVVAIKRIYVTSSPLRIENEIAILHELSGHKNVVPLITAARHKDQVIVALPYFEHRDFRTYYRDLPMEDIRCYFRALLKGLAHVHSKGIIHRDVKPNNFLYDTEKKTGVIVDFGLAQRQENWPQKYGRSSSRLGSRTSKSSQDPKHNTDDSKAGPPQRHKKGDAAPNTKMTDDTAAAADVLSSALASNPNTTAAAITTHQKGSGTKDLHSRAPLPSIQRGANLSHAAAYGLPALAPSQLPNLTNHVRPKSSATGLHPGVPNPHASVLMANREPGFPRKDTRPVLRVNRAGTKGFRAPEVLFRHVCQTVALDIWSVGVILIAFLTGRFPFFNSDHEVEALLEIAVLFGQREMKKVAATFDRTFVTNLPSIKEHPMSITRICWSLHPKRFAPPEGYVSKSSSRPSAPVPPKIPTASAPAQSQGLSLHQILMPQQGDLGIDKSTATTSETDGAGENDKNPNVISKENTAERKTNDGEAKKPVVVGTDSQEDLEQAVSLLERLLTLDPTKRITAEEALKHPFLAEQPAK